jgi:deoxyribonuclease IV
MGKQSILGSFEDTMIMSKEVEGVLPCLDFAHLHARPGDGSVNSIKEWELLIYQYLKTLGEESISHLHIHVSGIEYTQMGEKKHLPLRESDFQIENLLILLKQSHFNGRILCESPILEEDAVYMLTYWESI